MSEKSMFDDFCTPSWAVTLVVGKVGRFSDTELSVMSIFIRDEIAKRKIAQSEAA